MTPMGRAVRLVGDAATLLIMISLQRGPRRFSELLEQLGPMSSRTLTQRLRLLEGLGFVERRVFPEIPPRVEYELTARGREFGQVIAAIEDFARKHLASPQPSTLCNAQPLALEATPSSVADTACLTQPGMTQEKLER
ncbi:MAG: helix-turn-helix transcriptional regulator [Thermogemmatispora sp.]|nr:helix-turn-helix transcriptional regulator [Thermogemmatispora sp.]